MKTQTTPLTPSAEKVSIGYREAKAAKWSDRKKSTKPTVDQEVYSSILARLDARSEANETIAIGLIGCAKKSGSTTVAANLALTASAEQRGRVLLVDANWDNPQINKTFRLSTGSGLYDVLSEESLSTSWQPQVVSEHLDVLGRGKWNEKQPVHVRQEMVVEMLADLKTEYSLILVDLPAAEEMRNALPLARELDGNLLITRFETVNQTQALRVAQRLHDDGVAIWGTVLNRHREYAPNWLRKRF